MRIARFLGAGFLFAAIGAAAFAEPASPFDGKWDATLTCPPHHEDEDAKGYVHRFPVEVRNAVVRGVHGAEGEPGWHLLTGTIAKDGNAALSLEGIVNHPDHSVNNAYRGKSYSYRVRATFEPSVGTGQRVGKRKCSFRFDRRS